MPAPPKWIVLILTLGLAGPLTAQPDPPCAHPHLAPIRFLEGSWDIQAQARLSADPTDWETGEASATIESAMRDCAFVERYAGRRRGQPFEALRVFAAAASSPGLRLVLADSEHGPLFVLDGGPEAEGVAFYTSVTTPAGPVRLRVRLRDIATDSFVVESQRSVDAGRTWDTTGRAHYRRRAP
jgi:hypothetical protein